MRQDVKKGWSETGALFNAGQQCKIVEGVVMSQQLFEEQQALLELYEKLDEAEEQSRDGKRRPFLEAMTELRSRVHAKMPS